MTPKKPMLAVSESITDEEVRFPVIASPKYDGIRCTVWPSGPLTRSLKPVPNKFIDATLRAARFPAPFDGELIVGSPTAENVFNASTSGVMSHDGEPDFAFYVFDFVPKYEPAMPFYMRSDMLQDRTSAIQAFNPWLKIVEHVTVHSLQQLHALEEQNLLAGFEGTMLNGVDAHYKHGRSTLREYGSMKRKPFEDAEALVIGVEEQMQNTNEATVNELGNTKRSSAQAGMVGKNTLGAFVCRTPEGIEFRLGTGQGLTEALRAQLWAIRDTLPGRIVKYKRQKVGAKVAPRIPVWLGFRDPRDMS